MKQFSVLQAPVLAFFSRDFYRDVAKNWKGAGFGALFLMLLVFWTAISIRTFFTISQQLESAEVNLLIEKLPTMDIKDGQLAIDKPSPYTIYLPGSETEPLITFDTSGKLKTLEDTNGAKALATAKELLVKKEDETQAFPWKSLGNSFHATPSDVKSAMKTFGVFLFGASWVCGIFIFVGHILAALIYGLIGLIMDRNKLGYGTCLRVATLAMTPAVVLSSLWSILGIQIPAWTLITIPLSLGYLYFGLASLDPETPLSAGMPPSTETPTP